jgi:SHS2 domain-containing protein
MSLLPRWEHFHHAADVGVRGWRTLTQLKVAQEPDGSWVAQCVVDV